MYVCQCVQILIIHIFKENNACIILYDFVSFSASSSVFYDTITNIQICSIHIIFLIFYNLIPTHPSNAHLYYYCFSL